MSYRNPRGRVTKQGTPGDKEPLAKPAPPKLIFGMHERCSVCKGSGKRPKKKELCGQCGGTGVFTKKPPE